jgi:DNA replication licensing factor MCM5
MKKYIQYCKSKCSPRLSEEAGEILTSHYVSIRDGVRKKAIQSKSNKTVDQDGNSSNDGQAAIPITVRQLEALIRLSESLAKMRLEDEVQAQDIDESLRLFTVSTMAANCADQNNAANPSNGKQSAVLPSRDEIMRTESFLRSRLVIGTIVNKQRIVEEAASQGYDAAVVSRAIAIMIMRGELTERNQGRLFKRVK